MDLDAAVVALALHPFSELPPAPGSERIEQDGLLLVFYPHPIAQPVEPLDLQVAAVPLAVAGARAAAQKRNRRLLAWWLAPEHAALGSALEQEGLKNEDTPGFEAIENAMVLVHQPTGQSDPQIAVRTVESYEDFTAADSVVMDAFEFPDAMRAEGISELPQRWDDYRRPGNPGRQYLATIRNDVVGTAAATFGDAGINLFGGAVLPNARGRGVYRALTLARWEEAVQRGTPALTVQAGRMSKPILTKLGFNPVGEARIYVDDVEVATTSPSRR